MEQETAGREHQIIPAHPGYGMHHIVEGEIGPRIPIIAWMIIKEPQLGHSYRWEVRPVLAVEVPPIDEGFCIQLPDGTFMFPDEPWPCSLEDAKRRAEAQWKWERKMQRG